MNLTKGSVVIRGSRGGFLSLANVILFYLNDLEDVIELHGMEFVTSDIHLTIASDDSPKNVDYGTLQQLSKKELFGNCQNPKYVEWLGYVNSELHFDEGKNPADITVYCVVG